MITIILLGVLIALFFYSFINLKSRYEYFTRRNIPGPRPKFFFGNYLSIWSTLSFNRQIQKWTRQYGSLYGIFQGTSPVYVVSDVDFLEEVYIKQFSIFHSRQNNILTRLTKTDATSLFTAYGNQWRRHRHVINPTFSTAKLKMMTPLINKCIMSVMNKIDENYGKEFNIFILYKRLTMDVICKSAIFCISYSMSHSHF
jgi:cytochrome P450